MAARWALHLLCLLAAASGCATQRQDASPPESLASPPAAPAPGSSSHPASNADLKFLGTVTAIEPANTGDPLKRWIITTRVDAVLSGAFSQPQFSFAVHSPAQSGLELGKQYTIVAARTPRGYTVDPYQWRREQ
jgi:hypothetical protein